MANIIGCVGRIRVRDKVYLVVNNSKESVGFRVHWLPSYIRDSFEEDFFSSYDKMMSVILGCTAIQVSDGLY